MDYSNIKYVKKRIITSLLFILVVFLLGGAISHIFYQLQMLLRWGGIIVICFFACNIWGSIVGYNSAVHFSCKIRSLEDDISAMKSWAKK